jgi:hypothetical protein
MQSRKLLAGVVSLVRDLAAVLLAAPLVERGRLRRGPRPLLARLRARGLRGPIRTDRERARLAKIVRFVDRCFPGGDNCYRRALLEIAVDPIAAKTPLNLGLKSDGGPRSGHAWLASSTEAVAPYDAEFSV